MYGETLLTLALFALAYSADDWNYRKGEAGGPEYWTNLQKNCAGSGQSPVNIDTSKVKYDDDLFIDRFQFHGYDTTDDIKFRLGNNGHTVQIVVEGDEQYITGGGLPGKYLTLQIHWHWGSQSDQGSEHCRNGEFYPLEMHMVHYNYEYNVSQALAAPNGLAVLGFFYKISPYDNQAFESIVSHFEKVIYKNQEEYIPPIELKKLFPTSMDHFYRYKGSLTTPGCYESVFWTVFETPIEISERQMDKFRMLMEKEKPSAGVTPDPHYMLSNNYRPLQKLNDRIVYTNMAWQDREITSGVTRKTGFIWLIILQVVGFVSHFTL